MTELITRSITRDVTRSPTQGLFQPQDLQGLVLHCRYQRGITVTGAGVSQWDDVSGQGNHLKQGTDTNRPSKESDGSILFDGIDNYLKADAFMLVQPTTVYFLGKQVTWTNSDRIFDGNVFNAGGMIQTSSTPDIAIFAGGSPISAGDLSIDTYAVVASVFNSTNSRIQINNNATVTGSAGTSSMSGFTLGADGANLQWSNIQIKEVITYNTAHDSNTRQRVIDYLAFVGNLSI